MAHLIDSSVWVALFLDFDTHHRKAERILSTVSGTISVPYCVIAEVATVLAYKHSKRLADNFLAYIRGNKDIECINDDPFAEMDFYVTLSQKISFTDGALLFLSRRMPATLITFDKQLERMAKKNR
ncbi:MAG: type II toxin-antitoxin system VapC family toxin [Patescibacteria group bacterium]